MLYMPRSERLITPIEAFPDTTFVAIRSAGSDGWIHPQIQDGLSPRLFGSADFQRLIDTDLVHKFRRRIDALISYQLTPKGERLKRALIGGYTAPSDSTQTRENTI